MRKGSKHTKESKEKIKKTLVGRKIFWADKISKSLKGNPKLGGIKTRFKKGHKQLNTGRTHFKKGEKREKKGLIKECLNCKNKFYVSLSSTRKFCSKECYSKFQKGRSNGQKGKKYPERQGKNNLRWKGGYERTLWRNRRRRMIRKNIEGFHTLEEWEELKKKCNYTCQKCGKQEPEIKLTEDHIIPITKDGTTDYIENIQPLCLICNPSKGNKIIKYLR